MRMEAGLSSGSIEGARLEPMVRRRWTGGGVTAFVRRYGLAWELGMACLTVVYVVLAFFQDQGASGLISAGVLALAAIFLAEFSLRLYDSESRVGYCQKHWLDIITCIPVVGPFRALRLLRLLAFVRLGATARSFGVGAVAIDRVRGGTGIPAGKLLTGLVIFLGIGLLGFASAQLTAKLLPQKNELAELREVLEHQTLLIEGLTSRVEGIGLVKDSGSSGVAFARESQVHVAASTRT